MALTINSTQTLQLLNILNRTSIAQNRVTMQLATGRRILAGKDDPAGLIALSSLNAELTAINESLRNNQRTDAMLTVAEGAMGEIASLLTEIESLVANSTSSANLTSAETAANQAQIDNALTAIDRIVNTTNFNGKKLLDGNFGIDTTGVVATRLGNLQVFSRGQRTSDTTMSLSRTASASTASATFAFMGAASTFRTSGTTQVVITGTLGTADIQLTSAMQQAAVVTAINAAKDETGVSAIQGNGFITLSSTTYGSAAFVSVEVLSGGYLNGTYTTATGDSDTANDILNSSKQSGSDATITINGQSATTDGLDVSYNANGLSLAFTLTESYGNGTLGATTSFTVKSTGGATFQLGSTANTRQTIGIDSLASYNLGGGNATSRLSELKSGGAVDLSTDTEGALNSVRAAIGEVASARGRLGGFQRLQVGSAINSLQVMQTGLKDAASVIGDTDFAVATSELNRQNVLMQMNIALLGVANQQAGQILSLLG